MSFEPYLNQDYEKLKKKLLKSKELFEDDTFPPEKKSITRSENDDKDYEVIWKRPHEIIENPQFIVDGINPNDLAQGDTGDCWFISAASSIAFIPEYYNRVIPPDQSFNKKYAGIFHFRIWQFGEFVDVVVDDYLPTKDGELIYCSNRVDKNEFFGPLLEKAYAKIYGCYEFLNSGNAVDSMTDLTGAICESFNLKKCLELSNHKNKSDLKDEDKKENVNKNDLKETTEKEDDYDELPKVITDIETLWTYLVRSTKMSSLMNASFGAYETETKEALQENGLFSGHTYSMLQAVELENKSKKDKTRLVKLRNPWGLENPWNGEWSLQSKNWKKLNKISKEKYKLSLDNYGEFYMSYEDFVNNFTDLIVAQTQMEGLFNSDEKNSTEGQNWTEARYFSEWINGKSAGTDDVNRYLKLYFTNVTQYLIKCDKPSQVIISLMQPYDIKVKTELNDQYYALKILFFTVTCEESLIEDKILAGAKFFKSELTLNESDELFFPLREVSERQNLQSGYYIVAPCTAASKVNLKYLLRIFHDKNSTQVFELKNE